MEITKELIEDLYVTKRLSTQEVCEIIGVGRTTFYKYQKKFGIDNRGKQKYDAKEDAFSSWSHKMAYCLGFISADGHVWKDRPFLSIAIQTSDVDILTYIKDFISPDSKVRNNPKHNMVQLTIKSHGIWNDLKRYNVTHDKTFNLKIDFDIPEEFWGDYLRGYFDGDGSIWISKKKDPPTYSGSIASASRQVLDDICNRLGFGYVRETHDGKYYSFDLSNKQLLLFKDIIYKDPSNVVMKRKYEKFLNIVAKDNFWWTDEEKLLLETNKTLALSELVKLFPNRTREAVQVRRSKIVRFSRNS